MSRTTFMNAPVRTPQTDKDGNVTKQWVDWYGQKYFGGQPEYLSGTDSERLAENPAQLTEGTTFYVTDRGWTYIVRGGYWEWLTGVYKATQANLPVGLGLHDEGLTVFVTDYGHLLRWSGTAWEWGPGENGSGFICGFLDAPMGSGWHLCDGSVVNRLDADGGLTSVTLPDYSTAAYLKLGTTVLAGPNGAGGTSQSVSAGTPAGTVTQTTPVTSGTPSGTSSAAVGVGATLAASNHTHDVAVDANPTFSGAAMAGHSHGPGTLDLANTQLKAYYRQ